MLENHLFYLSLCLIVVAADILREILTPDFHIANVALSRLSYAGLIDELLFIMLLYGWSRANSNRVNFSDRGTL